MTKIVLTQRADSGYDDTTGEWYQFPSRYYRIAKEAEGDGCLYYEPRRASGRLVYWASGIISKVIEDRVREGHYYARISEFLPFPNPIPFRRADGHYWESALDRGDGQPSRGAMGWSVRQIPEAEFDLILRAGYSTVLYAQERPNGFLHGDLSRALDLQEDAAEYVRPVIQQITNRRFRDRVFSAHVREAYECRCAITGLKIINGGGHPEMEAAHIRPVEQNGLDSVRNGIALTRTAHWLFDRGLISIDDDYTLLKAKRLISQEVERLFDPSGKVNVPMDERARPNPVFLQWHRDNCFKG